MVSEFEEIGHSGGKITFSIKTNDKGLRSYQMTYSWSRPVPRAIIAVYALPQGVPVEAIQLGGIGQPWNPAPFPGAFQYLLPAIVKGSLGITAHIATDIGAVAHGPTCALIVLPRRRAMNFFQKLNYAMCVTTVRS